MARSALLLAVVLTLAGCIRCEAADFDFFYLVRQWPASFCSEHQCTHAPNAREGFTIHGLWPNFANGTYPEMCQPENQFSETAVKDLLPEMIEHWPSYMSGNDEFWGHEWVKHGTCALSVLETEHDYFAAVLQLHEDLDIPDALKEYGIVPSLTRTYTGRAIATAIKLTYGVMPLLHCGGEGRLDEIWICIDLNLNPIDCSGPHQSRHLNSITSGGRCSHVRLDPIAEYSSEQETVLHTTQSEAVRVVTAA